MSEPYCTSKRNISHWHDWLQEAQRLGDVPLARPRLGISRETWSKGKRRWIEGKGEWSALPDRSRCPIISGGATKKSLIRRNSVPFHAPVTPRP